MLPKSVSGTSSKSLILLKKREEEPLLVLRPLLSPVLFRPLKVFDPSQLFFFVGGVDRYVMM